MQPIYPSESPTLASLTPTPEAWNPLTDHLCISSFSGPFRFLSNFWPAPVSLNSLIYPTVEHAYQAAKTLDPDHRQRIRRAPTPKDPKRLGHRLTVRLDWELVKVSTMRRLLIQKFSDPVLATQLLRTAPHTLIEGNTWGDRFWGICEGEGQNWLGRLLMEIRETLTP